ncbi:hypothetical protein A3852_20775 [Rhodococcus qingshengii]|uniref:hypothetical protein n=1 Tax=Rhodococcus TaxID=1827 RepID=UPI0007AE3AF6|nr:MULTISPECIES: hypothetical protein [Rhodococcus]KZL31383.1 hypothetical protein A3852_20775 [Rhodococcus qingshengii]QOS66252.1 hypothetical protein IM699_28960 [Rhodococcus qingshengii]
MTEAMPSDDFVVSFSTTEDARAWLIDRVAYLAGVAGQQGSPRVSFSALRTANVAGSGASTPAMYYYETDELVFHPREVATGIINTQIADAIVLHELGHRADPGPMLRKRISQGLWIVAAVAGMWFLLSHSGWAVALLSVTGLLGYVWLSWNASALRKEEDMADDYALAHGGSEPILSFLRASVVDPTAEGTAVHRKPADRLARMERKVAETGAVPRRF